MFEVIAEDIEWSPTEGISTGWSKAFPGRSWAEINPVLLHKSPNRLSGSEVPRSDQFHIEIREKNC